MTRIYSSVIGGFENRLFPFLAVSLPASGTSKFSR
jgi:hypothetical protein